MTKVSSSGLPADPSVYKFEIRNLSSVPNANPHLALPFLSNLNLDHVLLPVLLIVRVEKYVPSAILPGVVIL